MNHNRWWKRAAGAATASVLVLATAACAGSTSTPSASADVDPEATFRVNLPVASSLNPTEISIASMGMTSLWPVYDRLIAINSDSTYAPMLATDWAFSEDGLTLSLNLRKGVTFSDGAAFDAEAAKKSLDFLRTSEAFSSSGPLETIKDVTAASPTELVLSLTEPSTAVLGALATPNSGAMISPAAIADGDLASNPVGTGAWTVADFKPGVEVSYERRPDGIWDKESGKVKVVTITSFTSPEARTNAIRSGQYDLTSYAGTDAPALSADLESGKLQLKQLTGLLNYTMFLNTNKAPLDDLKVRQAVNFALDRENLAGVIDDEASPRTQPYTDGLPGFDKSLENTYSRDVKKAQALLAEAGHADGIDIGEILVANSGGFPELAQAVQANLKDAGISVDIKSVDVGQVNAEWSKGAASGMMTYQSPPDLEPINFFARNYLNSFWWIGDVPAELTGMLDGVGDPRRASEQDKLVQAVNAYATENALFAPILQKPVGHVASAKVQNYETAPFVQFGGGDWRFVSITK